MQTDHHDHTVEEISDEWRFLNGHSLDPNAADFGPDLSKTACPTETRDGIGEARGHERGGLHPRSAPPGFLDSETNGLAGNRHVELLDKVRGRRGNMAVSVVTSSADSKSSTTQVRLRLPEEFAEFLDRQSDKVRGAVFVAVVFGQIPIFQGSAEYTKAVECLRRLAVLLKFASEREMDMPLATDARQAIKLINRLTRKSHLGCAYRRLRLPVEYADALPTSLRQREHLVRLAVRASAMSISLRNLVTVAPSLELLRNRLVEKLGSAADACPAEEVRSVVQAVLGLSKSGRKGGSK